MSYVEDSKLIEEIKDISNQISSRNISSISCLLDYANKIEEYESIKNKYESGELFNITPLEDFSEQATILSNFIDELSIRYTNLNNINNTQILDSIKSSLINIDTFFSKYEDLRIQLMKSSFLVLKNEIDVINTSIKLSFDKIKKLNEITDISKKEKDNTDSNEKSNTGTKENSNIKDSKKESDYSEKKENGSTKVPEKNDDKSENKNNITIDYKILFWCSIFLVILLLVMVFSLIKKYKL